MLFPMVITTLLVTLGGGSPLPFLSDPIEACETCLRMSFHAFCWSDNTCYSEGGYHPPSACAGGKASCSARPGGLGGHPCDCSECCGTDECGAPQCPAPGPSPGPAPTCGKKIQYPSGHFPTLQAQRPPQQTAVQGAVVAGNIKDAAALSAAAEPWVRNYLDTTVRAGVRGT